MYSASADIFAEALLTFRLRYGTMYKGGIYYESENYKRDKGSYYIVQVR